MKYKKILIGLLGALMAFSSCDSYLDQVAEDDVLDIPVAFETRDGAQRWFGQTYGTVYKFIMNSIGTDPGFFSSDEFVGGEYARQTQYLSFFLIPDGQQTALSPLGDQWTTSALYYYIRWANTFLEMIGTTYNLRDGELELWTAEMRFAKAVYYFELIRRYGPIVLVPENIGVNTPVAEMRRPRSHIDDCFDAVVELLDQAIPDLPTRATQNISRRQITKEGAMAYKAKVLLYKASPLYNGNSIWYGDFRNYKGEPLFDPEYKAEKWLAAAEAIEEAIALCDAEGYKLIEGSEDQRSDLLNTMRDIELSIWDHNYTSTEAVLSPGIPPTGVDHYSGYTMPRIGTTANDPHYSSIFYGSVGTTYQMAEMFYTANGLPITYDPNWTVSKHQLQAEQDSKYVDVLPLGVTATTIGLHLKREPRFYASIAAPGTYWQRGNSAQVTAGDKSDILLVDPYLRTGKFRQNNGILNPSMGQNISGYWVKKGSRSEVHTKDYFTGINGLGNISVVAIRLADLYLMAAEAWNEYEGPNGAHRRQLFDRINAVRIRAGIPTVENSWSRSSIPTKYTTKDGMRDIIQQERAIELMFEGHRFWDLRRWKKAHEVLPDNKPLGWYMPGDGAQAFFNNGNGPVEVWNKFRFEFPRDYLFPIRSEEVNISGNKQNPGW